MSGKGDKKAIGRPGSHVYSTAIADEIIQRLIDGEDIVTICKDPAMPARGLVYAWLDRYPEFRTRYEKAREGLADVCVQKVLEIAEKTTDERVKADSVKLRALTWAATRFSPRQYSERMASEQASSLTVDLNGDRSQYSLAHMSDEEKGELRRLLEKARNPIGLIEGS